MSIQPVTTLAELDALDEGLMVLVYRHAMERIPDYTQRDKAYWHGYLNGQVDRGDAPISTEQCLLARAYVARCRAN